ncbi:TatD family hydrolase, partial [Oscillospiraceae bacterium OttesenSCG-928-G22]|nr:TatD family hydrolase [Oscillospiraceae bacterium OttesenSCG-928-G22]
MEQIYFDTHAHYDDKRFAADRDALLAGLPKEGVRYVINPGSSLASTERAIALSEAYPFLYAAAGVHPHEAAE